MLKMVSVNTQLPILDSQQFDCTIITVYICTIELTNILMQAARETGALKEAKDKLEKRVEELTWRLEFEKHLRVYFILKFQKKYN